MENKKPGYIVTDYNETYNQYKTGSKPKKVNVLSLDKRVKALENASQGWKLLDQRVTSIQKYSSEKTIISKLVIAGLLVSLLIALIA